MRCRLQYVEFGIYVCTFILGVFFKMQICFKTLKKGLALQDLFVLFLLILV